MAITSSNFILFSQFWVHHRDLFDALFLIYIKSNHIVSTVKQLTAEDIILFIAMLKL